jgi:exosortase/archaeosortase family protein
MADNETVLSWLPALRPAAPSPESAGRARGPDAGVPALLLASTAAVLLLLPFVTTFNDLLTTAVIRLGALGPFAAVAEAETRMVTVLLSSAGMGVAVSGAHLVVTAPGRPAQDLSISWNCVGWQSLILLGLSLPAGLRGLRGVRFDVRLQVILLGLLGTVAVNLVRITAVCVLAALGGRVAAIMFHDYGGTLLVLVWLFVFWGLTQRWLLIASIPVDRTP